MKKVSLELSQIKSGIIAALLACVMALCMVPTVTGGSALAAEEANSQAATDATYTLAFNNQTATVQAGQQLDISTFINKKRTDYPSDGHIDYFIEPSSSLASINKHSGILTANAAGTVTVVAYAVKGEPQQKPGKCNETVYAQASKTVTITTPVSEYGFQGGSNAIKMISPTVTSYSGDLATGYENTIDEAVATDGYVYFTYQTTTGFKTYNTPEGYASINKDNISVTFDGETYTLGTNQNVLSVSSIDQSSQQITLRVATAELMSNTGTLTFNPGLRGNSDTRLLETTVKFNFTIVS